MKNIRIFYLKIFKFLVVKFSIYLNRRVFVMWVVNVPRSQDYMRYMRRVYDTRLDI